MSDPANFGETSNRLRGRVCLVTGGTSGIGRVTAVTFGGMGATVLLTGRDRARGEAAAADIRQRGGTAEFLPVDFASLRAVRELAATVRALQGRLDVLVNNAGGVNMQRELTVDGIERTFAINHLAPFLLTQELRELLLASGAARIITVSSQAHRMVKQLDFDNLQGEKSYKPLMAYGISKLANILFTYELDRQLRDRGIAANCLHPGVVRTGIWNVSSGFLRVLIALGKPFMITPEQGARQMIRLASDPSCAAIGGRYFEKEKETRSSDLSYDPALAQRLWELSETMVAVAR